MMEQGRKKLNALKDEPEGAGRIFSENASHRAIQQTRGSLQAQNQRTRIDVAK